MSEDTSPQTNTDQATEAVAIVEVPKKSLRTGFFRSLLEPDVKVELSIPMYPSTLKRPITFFLDLGIGEDAEKAQSVFLGLSDDEQEAERFKYDVEMLALLSTRAPLNFDEFPEVDQARIDAGDYSELRAAIRSFFTETADPVVEKHLKLIARYLMGRYWNRVSPADYL